MAKRRSWPVTRKCYNGGMCLSIMAGYSHVECLDMYRESLTLKKTSQAGICLESSYGSLISRPISKNFPKSKYQYSSRLGSWKAGAINFNFRETVVTIFVCFLGTPFHTVCKILRNLSPRLET